LAGGSDVSADFGDDDGFFAEAYGEVAGNAGVEFTHGVFGPFSSATDTLTVTVSIARGLVEV
jgi:hypothetical protein